MPTTSHSPPSSNASREGFDTVEEMNRKWMESTGDDGRTARRRVCDSYLTVSSLTLSQALARDGYRCMITGAIDRSSFTSNKALREISKRDGISVTWLEASHIFSESTAQGIDSAGAGTVNKVHSR